MAEPVNTVAPTITGTVEVGETLTCSTGTWSPSPTSYAYQWQRVNAATVDISGATQATYVITADDVGHYLQCKVIATNNTGPSLPAYTDQTVIVPADWFIVEDGTAKSDAVSYVSVSAADEYHAKRGNTAWTNLTNSQKHLLLVRATDYIEQMYRERWEGVRATITQSLSWPREYVEYPDVADFYPTSYYPENQVPAEVKNACAELALKANADALSPDVDRVTAREKLGPMEVEYQSYGKPYKMFRSIDNMLSVWLQSTGGAFKRLVRT